MQYPKSALAKFHGLQKLIQQQKNSNHEKVSTYLRLTQMSLSQTGPTDLNALHKVMQKA